MPTHRELTKEELNMLEKGGGVKEEMKKERKRWLDGLYIFIQEKEKQTIEDLLLSEVCGASSSGH